MSVQYESRHIVFLDTLGFKEAVRRFEVEPTFLAEVHEALHTYERLGSVGAKLDKSNAASKGAFRATTFSDSIVISIRQDIPLALLDLFVSAIAVGLMRIGLLVRGGIASGPLVHEGSLVLGEGLITAYQQEDRAAIYPRILVADALVKIREELNAPLPPSYRRDFDGLVYLDVLDQAFASKIWHPDQSIRSRRSMAVQRYLSASRGCTAASGTSDGPQATRRAIGL